MSESNGAGRVLTAADLSKPVNLSLEPFELPEFGGTAYLKGMTAREKVMIRQKSVNEAGEFDRKLAAMHELRVCAFCLRDSDGNRLINDANVIADWPAPLVERVYNRCEELSGRVAGLEQLGNESEPAPSC